MCEIVIILQKANTKIHLLNSNYYGNESNE